MHCGISESFPHTQFRFVRPRLGSVSWARFTGLVAYEIISSGTSSCGILSSRMLLSRTPSSGTPSSSTPSCGISSCGRLSCGILSSGTPSSVTPSSGGFSLCDSLIGILSSGSSMLAYAFLSTSPIKMLHPAMLCKSSLILFYSQSMQCKCPSMPMLMLPRTNANPITPASISINPCSHQCTRNNAFSRAPPC